MNTDTTLTEDEYAEHAANRGDLPPHPLCGLLRELRQARRLSLTAFHNRTGIPAVVLGAYERGDRLPPLPKLDAILSFYGYELRAVPVGADAVQRTDDMVTQLRSIANQLESTAQMDDER